MAPTALVTIQLDGWPPPIIEIHALIAALPRVRPGSQDTPANVIQHLNEVVLAFPATEPNSPTAIARVRAVARAALASTCDGAFHVTRARITP